MKLFYAPNSPFARKARVVIREKGIEGVEEVLTMPMDNEPEFLAINPLATVPALLLPGSRALCDSTVICEYLDSLPSGRPSLYPPHEGRQRWDVLGLAALADGLMDAAVQVVLENRKPETQRAEAWITRKKEAIMRTIGLLAHRKFQPGQPMDIAIIGVVCALDYVRFRLPELDWQGKQPELAAWLAKTVQNGAFPGTAPQP